MLEPRERTLLQKALQPPDGYRVDYAIGTTFSLDLVSLLTAPLAFTMFEPEEDEGTARQESLALLESVRRYAKRITMFCQGGRIAYPRARYPQFAWLEQSVVQCHTRHGLFHPKVWVLRYTNGGPEVRYRALCLSRNLTIANSWDTLLALDGEVGALEPLAVDPRPLADFVAALPAMAKPRPAELVLARIAECSAELRTVSFTPPAPFTDCTFRPLGISGYSGWPFGPARGDALVVSPFLSVAALERLSQGRSSTLLVSSPDSLLELPRRPKGISDFRVLDEDALAELPPEADESSATHADDMVQLVGLHAKLYVLENGREAEVWTGSANATDAAFSTNVEFMVQLRGPKNRVGIAALMEPEKDSLRLCDVLKDATGVAVPRKTEIEKGLEAQVERAREWLAGLDLVGNVTARDDKFALQIDAIGDMTSAPEGATIVCWPVLVGEACGQRVSDRTPLATFEGVSLEGLSAFIAFKASARKAESEFQARFLLNIPLVGAPPDREEKLLRALIKDRARLVHFLTLLLADDGTVPQELLRPSGTPGPGDGSPSAQAVPDSSGLLELLVRALARSPERLDDVAGLVREYGRDASGQDILPEEFESIWRPIWEARGAIKCETS